MNNIMLDPGPQEILKVEPVSLFSPVSLADLLAREYHEPEWLVEGLIPADGVTVMGGAPASGLHPAPQRVYAGLHRAGVGLFS